MPLYGGPPLSVYLDILRSNQHGVVQALNSMRDAAFEMDELMHGGLRRWSVPLYIALNRVDTSYRQLLAAWTGDAVNHTDLRTRLTSAMDTTRTSIGELAAIIELHGIASLGTSFDVSAFARHPVDGLSVPIPGLTVKVLAHTADIAPGSVAAIRNAAGVPGRRQGQPFSGDEFNRMLRVCSGPNAKRLWQRAAQAWRTRVDVHNP